MSKTYRYKNLSFSIHDLEEANFTVEFVSDGNTGPTEIAVPGKPDSMTILDEGTKLLGKGKDLRLKVTKSCSVISNLAAQEDEIKIQYKINGKLLLEHTNSKDEAKQVDIILNIKFTQP